MLDPKAIIETLNRHRVEYLIIGGVAATLHGCPEQTFDVDILYNAAKENKDRLLTALDEMEARWDEPLTGAALEKQSVFALNTKYGDLDIFSYVPGIGEFHEALQYREDSRYADVEMRMLSLEGWLKSKEAVIGEERNPRKLGAIEYMKTLKGMKRGK